jgi:hypothetical protein
MSTFDRMCETFNPGSCKPGMTYLRMQRRQDRSFWGAIGVPLPAETTVAVLSPPSTSIAFSSSAAGSYGSATATRL